MYQVTDLFDLTHTLAQPLLAQCRYPWEALEGIGDFIRALGPTLPKEDYDNPAPAVWIARSAKVALRPVSPARASSAPRRRCATVPLSGAAPWWERALWWATPRS